MATTILPHVQPARPRQRVDAKLLAMAAYLKQRAARDARWGVNFTRALDKAVAQHQQGHTAERVTAGYWQAPSASEDFIRYDVNRWHCSCRAGQRELWCWHRAQVLWLEVEAEFDAVHGLADDDEDFEEEPDCQPSYRLIRELGD